MKYTLLVSAYVLVCGMVYASNLRGAIVVAADGTFLGTCDGAYGVNSMSNEYGRYGSPYSNTSIFNKYGQYGSEYAIYSAFNKYSSSPPYLLAADAALLKQITSISYRPSPAITNALQISGGARVSKNTSLSRVVDPNDLRAACRSP